LHHFEHVRDDFLQDVRLFANDFICGFVGKKQNALQPIKKTRQHLVMLVLFLQELNDQVSPLASDTPEVGRTSNVTLATLKATFVIGFN